MIRPLQSHVFPSVGVQQSSALPMQSSVLPAQTGDTSVLTTLLPLMIQMMIVVMMMKMMMGIMAKVS